MNAIIFRRLEQESASKETTNRPDSTQRTATSFGQAFQTTDSKISSTVNQLSFFYNDLSALLSSFREKLVKEDGSVSVTALICTALGTLTISAFISTGSAAYVHVVFSKRIIKISAAYEQMGHIVLKMRDLVCKPETTCVVKNECV